MGKVEKKIVRSGGGTSQDNDSSGTSSLSGRIVVKTVLLKADPGASARIRRVNARLRGASTVESSA